MNEFIDTLKSVLPLLTALLTAAGALYFSLEKDKKPMWENRYYKLIFPIYDVLEPELYCITHKQETIKKINKIIAENKSIAGSRLIFRAKQCENTDNQKAFIELCQLVSQDYDFLCKKLSIPERTDVYKIERHQFKSKCALLAAKVSRAAFWAAAGVLYLTFLLTTLSVLFSQIQGI